MKKEIHNGSRKEFHGESSVEGDIHNWHPGIPQLENGFPEGANFTLTNEEAEYLRERIMTNCPRSLLAFLVREGIDTDLAEFAWHLDTPLPDYHQMEIEHARNFSETVHGAQFLYNLILAEKLPWTEKIDEYREALEEWWQHISARKSQLNIWDQRRFWEIVYRSNPRISPRARSFIREWIRLVIHAPDLSTIIENKKTRQLIENRELQLKGGLARIRNQRARELWNGAAGVLQFDFRWNGACRIVSDILSARGMESHA